MSAPDTNIRRQEHQHRAPLTGMKAVVGFVAVLLLIYVGYLFVAADAPEATDQPAAITQEIQSTTDSGTTDSGTVETLPQDPVSNIVNPGAPEAGGSN